MSNSLLMTTFCGLVFSAASFDFAWALYKKRGNYKRPFYLAWASMWFCVVAIYFEGNKEANNYSEIINWALILVGGMCSGMDFKVNHTAAPLVRDPNVRTD
ncbi:hypothetical protein D3C87_1413090 [compost metagenome]